MKSAFTNGRTPSLVVLAITILLIAGCAGGNHPPSITDLKAETDIVLSSGSCQVECIALDSEGEELNYEWEASGGHISGKGPKVTWVAPEEPGEYTVSVHVTDEDSNEATRSITISVRKNHPPQIDSLRTSSEMVVPSGNCTITCAAFDPNGDKLSYIWSASSGNISTTGPVITWTAPETAGNYTITVEVIDDVGGKSTSSLSIDVVLNNPPIIENLIVTAEHKYLKEIPEGYKILKAKSYDIECIASDPENDELLYEWSTDGHNISAEGSVITWTAPFQGGEVTITVTVSDSIGGIASKNIIFEVATCAPCAFK